MKLIINLSEEVRKKLEELKNYRHDIDDWINNYLNEQLLTEIDRILRNYKSGKIRGQILNLFEKSKAVKHEDILRRVDADKKDVEDYLYKMISEGEIYQIEKDVYKLLER